MMNELKPCPFCGGKGVIIEDYPRTDYFVECDKCKTTSDTYQSKEEAIAAWSHRTNSAMIVDTPGGKVTMKQNGGNCMLIGYVHEMKL